MRETVAQIAARVAIVERWAYVTHRRGLDWYRMSALVEHPAHAGGLGLSVNTLTLRGRAQSYAAQHRERLAQLRADELARHVALSEQQLADAGLHLDSIPIGDFARSLAAIRRYERAEEALDAALVLERVPLTKALRDAVEVDIALDIAEAVKTYPPSDHAPLHRSLELDEPLARFAAMLPAHGEAP